MLPPPFNRFLRDYSYVPDDELDFAGGSQSVNLGADGRGDPEEEEDDKLPVPFKCSGRWISGKKLPIMVTDLDIFYCPICFENFKSRVYQCEEGHIICDSCCLKIHNKSCPSCSLPIGNIRCLVMEKILDASYVSCKNTIYGCETVVKYQDRDEHEPRCVYSPCYCPISNCDFVSTARKLYDHFDSDHFATSFCLDSFFSLTLEKQETFMFLKEDSEGALFVVNQVNVISRGRAISVVQIGPKSFSGIYIYELKMKDKGTSLILQSPVESVPKLDDYYRCTKSFLVVEDFVGPLEHARFDIRISLCD